MKIMFEAEYQAVEFASDCTRNGVVTMRIAETVEFAAYKLPIVAELLLASTKQ